MDERTFAAAPSDLNAKYEDAIRRRLDALMRQHRYSQIQFCELLRERGMALEQGNLSSMLRGRKRIPLSLIVHICDIFGISLAELVEEPSETAAPLPRVCSGELPEPISGLGDSFIIDPASPEFHGYLQTYHIYILPIHTYETRPMTGTLTLAARGGLCEAILGLSTNQISEGTPLQKRYRGQVLISTAIDTVYILLYSPIEGDLSIISFRHYLLPHQPLDCRIAAVLTNQSGEFHAPTMQRMFLSRTPIQPEHLPLLLPHLKLNSSSVCISEDKLERLQRSAPEYAELLHALTMIPASPVFCWSEDYVMGVARHFLKKSQVPVFLSRLRAFCLDEKANKASRRADSLARDLLLSLGYFHDHEL